MGYRARVFYGIFVIVFALTLNVSQAQAQEQEQTREEAAPVSVDESRLESVVEEVRVTGTVTSPRSARISAAVGGLVEQVQIEAGDRVEAGTVLVTIDSELARHQLSQLEAAVQQAQADLADARRRLQEAETLQNRQSIAESEVESRRAAAEAAAATLAQRQAEKALQQARLERHTVAAPFSGVVSRKLTASGEWVDPGTALLELVDLANLRIDFALPQEVFARLTLETSIQIIPSGHAEAVEGEILQIVPVTDPQARSFITHAAPKQNLSMMPGMSAQGVIRLITDQQAVVIPRDALVRAPSGRTSVWVLDENEDPPIARERKIEISATFADKVAVGEGLEEGETVIVRGNSRLQEGQTVRVQP